jgi:ferritin-like metal-binding protein YciE
MGLFNKDIRNLGDLFVHQLRDIYYAEKQIVQSLPDDRKGDRFEPQARFRDPSW